MVVGGWGRLSASLLSRWDVGEAFLSSNPSSGCVTLTREKKEQIMSYSIDCYWKIIQIHYYLYFSITISGEALDAAEVMHITTTKHANIWQENNSDNHITVNNSNIEKKFVDLKFINFLRIKKSKIENVWKYCISIQG